MCIRDRYGIVNFESANVHVKGMGEYRPVSAFSYLGRYRLVDFPLSNMSNSGIDQIKAVSYTHLDVYKRQMQIREALLALYARISDPSLSVRRITLTAADVVSDLQTPRVEQGDLFTDAQQAQQEYEKERKMLDKEKKLQEVTLAIKKKYGKNALLRGMDLEDGAKAKERNETIGGHQA